ncbi:MAG: 2-C-methyl-D-erythritol 2,4-cyclodiphosphate synthase [candidate division WOR-3 bacterium]
MTSLPRLCIGLGFDAHNLKRGRRLVLGGVTIPHPSGLTGHSDGDVLLHAITDAFLGATALPDLGTLFPDTDPTYKDADSAGLLLQAYSLVRQKGWRAASIDCVVVCDKPKLTPHAETIRSSIARLLSLRPDCVGFKAKTTEGTNLARPDRSIAALATVLLWRVK